ncbi:MAG: nucleotidyl transferase AbiEii/AbiGii toxin family protein [Candidatus Limnocylindrales bacterium]
MPSSSCTRAAAGTAQASTRYRDLADLALIAHTQSIAGDELRRALASEVRRRGLEAPNALPSPGAVGWRAGYARVAKDVPGLPERDLEAALATVRRFVDPVLGGSPAGTWDPGALTWSG